jgi:hypothetical protein
MREYVIASAQKATTTATSMIASHISALLCQPAWVLLPDVNSGA